MVVKTNLELTIEEGFKRIDQRIEMACEDLDDLAASYRWPWLKPFRTPWARELKRMAMPRERFEELYMGRFEPERVNN